VEAAPVGPVGPAGPVGPVLSNTIVKIAGWLVFRFSLLSNCTLVFPFAEIMNPLFEPMEIQPCTAAVASTERNVLPVTVATLRATWPPCDGGENPATDNSLQGEPAW
jgi:hypothetical protein